jgi:hypothetical protein
MWATLWNRPSIWSAMDGTAVNMSPPALKINVDISVSDLDDEV